MDLAARPVALGVAEVPVIVTVRLLNAVVPLVPSKPAKRTRISSTDVWFRAHEVNSTLPDVAPTIFKFAFNEKLERAPVPLVNWIALVGFIAPTDSIAGKLKVVSEAMELMIKLEPIVVNFGTLKVVNAAMVFGLNVTPTLTSSGRLKVVNDAMVDG